MLSPNSIVVEFTVVVVPFTIKSPAIVTFAPLISNAVLNEPLNDSNVSILPSWLEAVAFNDADVASNEVNLPSMFEPAPTADSNESNLLSTDVDNVLIVDAKLPLYALALANAPAAASTFVNNLLFTEVE